MFAIFSNQNLKRESTTENNFIKNEKVNLSDKISKIKGIESIKEKAFSKPILLQ